MDLEDDAKFQCQIGAADGVKPIRSRYATLTVLVPPEPPQLMPKGEVFKTVEGRQVELRCESRGGKPASEVRTQNFKMVPRDSLRFGSNMTQNNKKSYYSCKTW